MSAPSTPETHPGGFLFKLSPELRLMIYEQMFPPDPVDLFSFGKNLIKLPNPGIVAGNHVAVLATSRTIYDEAQPVLYKNTRFVIDCGWGKTIPDAGSAPIFTSATKAKYVPWYVNQVREWHRLRREGLKPDITDVQYETFTQIHLARSITLNVMVDEAGGNFENGKYVRNNAWIYRLPAEISSASDLEKLHITLFANERDRQRRLLLKSPLQCQGGLAETVAVLRQIVCKASVTAALDLSVARMGLTSMKYYTLLEKTKW
jgi:hypothetical protein